MEVAIIPQLATLLICSIMIDMNGLKLGGKAEDPNWEANAYLLPRSTLGWILTPVTSLGPGGLQCHPHTEGSHREAESQERRHVPSGDHGFITLQL